jgi:hypothetical protein
MKIKIETSPPKTVKCCQNCKHFVRFGVHLGHCCYQETERLDREKCKDFTKP